MEYDVFISHASEDKESFVKDLAANLQGRGLSVWYDDFTLRLGDSLSESIGKGLSGSSYGVVVISPHFIAKKWPKLELAALIAREDYADKIILPVWYGVTKQDVLDHLPLLADKLAINSEHGIEAVVQKILEVVSPSRVADKIYKQGDVFETKGDSAKAVASYIDALRIDRNHSLALNRLVGLLARRSLDAVSLLIILGHVKWFSNQKGYGFIEAENGKDYFIHISFLERAGISLEEGDRVAFLVRKAELKETKETVDTIASLRVISPRE